MFYEPIEHETRSPQEKQISEINPLCDIYDQGEVIEHRSRSRDGSVKSKSKKQMTVSSEDKVAKPKKFKVYNDDILKNGHKKSNNTMKLFKMNCEAINDFRNVRQRYLVESPFIKEDQQASMEVMKYEEELKQKSIKNEQEPQIEKQKLGKARKSRVRRTCENPKMGNFLKSVELKQYMDDLKQVSSPQRAKGHCLNDEIQKYINGLQPKTTKAIEV